MVVSIDDQLQSITGDLVGVRVALDSEWTEALTEEKGDSHLGLLLVAQLLAQAQSAITEARRRLKEVTDGQ